MMHRTRREFLADVGKGMLIASVGPALAADLGIAPAAAAEGPEALNFGNLEPLVCLMQETPADKLLPALVARLRQGTDLGQMIAAGALANARTFGGEDYIGFHTMMALTPAYQMARELPEDSRPLPVLKVLYRNTKRMQEQGGRQREVLHPVVPADVPTDKVPGEALLELVRKKDMKGADQLFAGVAQKSAEEAFENLLFAVQDCLDVHRIVMPYRAWSLLEVVGKENAHTMLRQSVHFCVKNESPRYSAHFSQPRALLPKLMDQYKLLSRPLGRRPAEDAWVDQMSQTIFKGPPDRAAEAVAAALAEGMAPDAIGEALSLATNQLILRDNGRPKEEDPRKPVGSVHGDSIGVHACDSANAWRNIARVSNQRNTVASLILGAYQAAFDRTDRGGDFLTWEPYPRADARARVKGQDPTALLRELHDAIRAKDQALASAVVHRYGDTGGEPRQIFDVLLRFAISEDGALHAEKYYRTAAEEFASTRAPFRWRQVVALARVTASEFGLPAPGYEEACRLLKA